VGGVERTIREVEDVEVVEMPRWSTMKYKPSCSKWWDPSERINGKYDGVEGGEGESKEIGGSRSLPDRKGKPGQESVEGGGYSPQVSGKVMKFVSMYEKKMQMKNRNISARKKSENIQSYFSVCGPMKKKFDISSPVKRLDMGKYGEFFSPASKRKYGVNMEHGHQCAGGKFLAGTDSVLDGIGEGPRRARDKQTNKETTEIWRAVLFKYNLGVTHLISNQFGIYGSQVIIIISQF
jgi:hypothetical protein